MGGGSTNLFVLYPSPSGGAGRHFSWVSAQLTPPILATWSEVRCGRSSTHLRLRTSHLMQQPEEKNTVVVVAHEPARTAADNRPAGRVGRSAPLLNMPSERRGAAPPPSHQVRTCSEFWADWAQAWTTARFIRKLGASSRIPVMATPSETRRANSTSPTEPRPLLLGGDVIVRTRRSTLFIDPPASSTHHDVTRPRAGSSKPRDLNERIRKPRVKRAKKEQKTRRAR